MPPHLDILKPSPEFLWKRYLELGSVHRVGAEYGVHGERIRQILMRAGYQLKNCSWSEADIVELRRLYAAPPEEVSIPKMAKLLRRTVGAIGLKAGELGLTDIHRPISLEGRERMKIAARDRIAKYGPATLGKKLRPHTDEEKARTGATVRRVFAEQRDAGIGMFSEEGRQKKSDTMMRIRATRPVSNPYSRCAGGRRADIGNQFFRSRWEANIARYLEWMKGQGLLINWEYEADTFWFEEIKRGTRSYTPDFKIWEKSDSDPYYWEVKGWMDPKSKTRLERMKKYHPSVVIHLIGQSEYNNIKQQVSGLIPNWENSVRSVAPLFTPLKYCPVCGRPFDGRRQAVNCSAICKLAARKVKEWAKRPSKEALYDKLSTDSIASTARFFSVPDDAITRWASGYGIVIPKHSRVGINKGITRRRTIGTDAWIAANNLTGQSIGDWTVVEFAKTNRHNQPLWNCKCACGRIIQVLHASLKRGKSVRCKKCSWATMRSRRWSKTQIAEAQKVVLVLETEDT